MNILEGLASIVTVCGGIYAIYLFGLRRRKRTRLHGSIKAMLKKKANTAGDSIDAKAVPLNHVAARYKVTEAEITDAIHGDDDIESFFDVAGHSCLRHR